MGNLVEQAYWAAAWEDPTFFLQHAFGTIYPGKQFLPNWHIDAIVHCLEEAGKGRSQRLIINLPPRYLKSFIVSVAWPAYVLGMDPTAKFICVSYSDELSSVLSRDFKRLVDSEWYKRLFESVHIVKSTEGQIITEQGGGRYATSVNGSITGRGADFIIVDDPIKPGEATSEKARHSVNEWYRQTLLSRLDDKERSVLVLVMQRLHTYDLVGFVEAAGGFHKLSLPAIAPRDEVIKLRRGLVHHRLAGTALHEEREGLKTLAQIRLDVGEYNFASQYQQSPSLPTGALFKRAWFDLVETLPEGEPDHIYVSIDTAMSTSSTADYSVLCVFHVYGPNYYVVQVERDKMEYVDLRKRVMAAARKYDDRVTFLIEKAGVGYSLLSELRAERIRCMEYKPTTDKMARACHAIPLLEKKRVKIYTNRGRNTWTEAYLNELLAFPFGRFDDQVDSLTQFVPWAERRHNPQGKVILIPY